MANALSALGFTSATGQEWTRNRLQDIGLSGLESNRTRPYAKSIF